MNILEALEVALPELPGRTGKPRYPQLDSRVIAREHVERSIRRWRARGRAIGFLQVRAPWAGACLNCQELPE